MSSSLFEEVDDYEEETETKLPYLPIITGIQELAIFVDDFQTLWMSELITYGRFLYNGEKFEETPQPKKKIPKIVLYYDGEQTECCISLEKIKFRDVYFQCQTCKNCFLFDNIQKWFQTSKKQNCPMCRHDFKDEKIICYVNGDYGMKSLTFKESVDLPNYEVFGIYEKISLAAEDCKNSVKIGGFFTQNENILKRLKLKGYKIEILSKIKIRISW